MNIMSSDFFQSQVVFYHRHGGSEGEADPRGARFFLGVPTKLSACWLTLYHLNTLKTSGFLTSGLWLLILVYAIDVVAYVG